MPCFSLFRQSADQLINFLLSQTLEMITWALGFRDGKESLIASVLISGVVLISLKYIDKFKYLKTKVRSCLLK